MTAIVHSICRSTFALPATIVLFLLAIFLQWNGAQSVAVADDIAYVTGGVNLVTTGSFTNPFGEPELWFPPVYPLAIGILSLGGLFDPFVVARLISVAAAVVTLILVHRLLERVLSSDDSGSHYLSLVPTIATLLLAMNPTFQTYANRALSESLAACLTITALSVWLRVEARILRSVLTGLFVALAALTRPECVLVLPLWCGLEVLFRRNLASVKHGLVAGLVSCRTRHGCISTRGSGQFQTKER
jgi:4-amino-4-deoxy-L-arabinose transferase-like glycosyltransferase